MVRTRVVVAVVVATATVWFAPPAVSPAGAAETPITCNMPVAGSIKVANDLVCTDTDALIVVADGTIIDLNGHRISCVGNGYEGSCQGVALVGGLSDADPDSGVDIDGRRNVKVFSSAPGGTIEGFDNAIDINNSDDVRVEQLVLTGPPGPAGALNPRPASHGVLIRGADCGGPIHVGGGQSKGNDISNHNQGVAINGDCVEVVQNRIHHNNSSFALRTGAPLIPPSTGILINSGSFNDLRGNEVNNNGDLVVAEGFDAGIRIRRPDSTRNHIRSNVVNDNLGDGILVEEGANGNYMNNNTMLRNGSVLSGTVYFDAAGRAAPGGPPGSAPLNEWNQNNTCITQNEEVPPGTCGDVS